MFHKTQFYIYPSTSHQAQLRSRAFGYKAKRTAFVSMKAMPPLAGTNAAIIGHFPRPAEWPFGHLIGHRHWPNWWSIWWCQSWSSVLYWRCLSVCHAGLLFIVHCADLLVFVPLYCLLCQWRQSQTVSCATVAAKSNTHSKVRTCTFTTNGQIQHWNHYILPIKAKLAYHLVP